MNEVKEGKRPKRGCKGQYGWSTKVAVLKKLQVLQRQNVRVAWKRTKATVPLRGVYQGITPHINGYQFCKAVEAAETAHHCAGCKPANIPVR